MDFVKQIPENDQHKLGMLLNLFHDGQKKIYTTIEKKCCSNAKKKYRKSSNQAADVDRLELQNQTKEIKG